MLEQQVARQDLVDPLSRYRNEVRETFGDLNLKGLPESRQDIRSLRARSNFHTPSN